MSKLRNQNQRRQLTSSMMLLFAGAFLLLSALFMILHWLHPGIGLQTYSILLWACSVALIILLLREGGTHAKDRTIKH